LRLFAIFIPIPTKNQTFKRVDCIRPLLKPK